MKIRLYNSFMKLDSKLLLQISQTIREERLKLNISQEKIAEALNLEVEILFKSKEK